ncbi:dihydrofolate reductase family protein [Pengzhenrongella frigida]|uniref:Deaminase n=1 Tax=Pengzhenrongella frigida TaxID=1259133 RepID=A0A4V1ZH10_9MICO|nr:dihydrofolate reductase family protein [Cellulomonas sp. HLT2-17]RYV50414.1 deaminase [Cellulomonas sp. HLT2-17]
MSDHQPPGLDVLLPLARAGEHLPADPGERALIALYPHPPASSGTAASSGPAASSGKAVWLRVNMISSLDGAATGADRRSGTINGDADLRVFGVLRAAADVVLIGAGTARAEGYGSIDVPAQLAASRAARGQRAALELAVVSGTGELPAALLDSDHPPLVVTITDRPDLEALRARIGADRVIVAGTGRVDLPAALAALADRGLVRVLAEGGPRLLGQLLTAGLVDELCLTWSPLVVGGPAPRVVDGAPWFVPALAATPAHLLHADAVLLGRWLL